MWDICHVLHQHHSTSAANSDIYKHHTSAKAGLPTSGQLSPCPMSSCVYSEEMEGRLQLRSWHSVSHACSMYNSYGVGASCFVSESSTSHHPGNTWSRQRQEAACWSLGTPARATLGRHTGSRSCDATLETCLGAHLLHSQAGSRMEEHIPTQS